MTDLTLIDWLGVLGSLLVAGAYLAVSRGRVDPERPLYNLANLAGAALILWSLWFRPNPGAILMELLWAAIALTALLRWAGRKRRSP